MSCLAEYRVAAEVGVRKVGDKVFLLAPGGELIVLENETAVFLWDCISAGVLSLEDMAERISETWEVQSAVAEADTTAFVGLLEANGILEDSAMHA